MPLPKRLARFNRVVTNPILRRVAGRLPGFAIVEHVGRRSGRTYRTPVNLFAASDGGYVIALTYGRDSEWVRNVLAARGCGAQTRGRQIRLSDPQIVHDEHQTLVPAAVRPMLALADVNDFMVLRRAAGGHSRSRRASAGSTPSVDEGDVMSDWNEQQHEPPVTGGENRGVEEDVGSSGDEGARTAETTPPIADDAVHGQTQAPPPPDDVGVPSDEEIAREEHSAGDEQ
jgi:deazaflavin-dependent oxidoreductase (nitroreductase family)